MDYNNNKYHMFAKLKRTDPENLRRYRDLPVPKVDEFDSLDAWFQIYETLMDTDDQHILKKALFYYLPGKMICRFRFEKECDYEYVKSKLIHGYYE